MMYEHMEKMSEERLVKRIYIAEGERTRGSGRPRTRWRDGVRRVLGDKGMTIQQAERYVQDIKNWRSI